MSFREDDAWQAEVAARLLDPWYARNADEGRFVRFRDGVGLHLQRTYGVDVAVEWKSRDIYVEEKIARQKHDTLFCETRTHCNTEPREGWYRKCCADRLLYCFALNEGATALECHWFDWPALRAWLEVQGPDLHRIYPTHQHDSEGFLVPLSGVPEGVPYMTFILGRMHAEAPSVSLNRKPLHQVTEEEIRARLKGVLDTAANLDADEAGFIKSQISRRAPPMSPKQRHYAERIIQFASREPVESVIEEGAA